MILFYQGGELPTYRNLMKEMKVPGTSMNYMALRKRTKFKTPWLISNYFPDTHRIFVDSGCSVLNNPNKENSYTDEDIRGFSAHYYSWVDSNIESMEYYTEFDALQLGKNYIETSRESRKDICFDKFVPIWHSENGLQDLADLAERFGRVGILQTNLGGRDLVPLLNRMANSGIELHGLAMTVPDVMQAVRWTSVSSTSWISPQKFGDTIIWSHNQLKRYPKSMKDQARKKERSAFLNAGFSVEKIMADDPKELLRMSLWSWEQLINSINRKQGTGVTTSMNFGEDDFTEFEDGDVGGVVEKVPNRVPTARPREASEKRTIPFLDFEIDVEKQRNKVTGEIEDIEVPKIRIRSESMRICDTCFLASKCPMFEPNTTCAYDIPIVIRTKEQMQAAVDSIVEMQLQRVLFMKMAEDAEGGYADPNLSLEIDRFNKLAKTKHEMEQQGFSLTVTAKQSGEMNMVERIFGDMGNTKPLTELEAPRQVPDVFAELGFIDAEVIDMPNFEERQ